MADIRNLIEQHYRNVNDRAWDREDEVLAPDVVTIHPGAPPLHGIEAFVDFARAFHVGFPDARLESRLIVAEGDRAMVEGAYIGTHTGPMAGPGGAIPPTGRRLDLPFCDVFEARGGRITAHRVYYDQATFAEQLGLTEASAAAR